MTENVQKKQKTKDEHILPVHVLHTSEDHDAVCETTLYQKV